MFLTVLIFLRFVYIGSKTAFWFGSGWLFVLYTSYLPSNIFPSFPISRLAFLPFCSDNFSDHARYLGL